MRESDLPDLAKRLLQSGIPARHVRRTVNELRDHFDDLVAEGRAAGRPHDDARHYAASELGAIDDFVARMNDCRELKSWPYRFPRLALVFYPLACLVALPALPVFAGVAHRSSVARWGVALLAAGLVTAAMMLVLQLSILFA